MGRSGYDTTDLGSFVRSNPRWAGGNRAGAGAGQKSAGKAFGPPVTTGPMQQAGSAAGSASASSKNRGGGAVPPKK
ncbi:hypothetical protein CDEST_08060 [Colletotrichum destructivum]|uniref:Uncharacterized protein n=1 Tax=Colletotrichum destructivum TaxID=34406 RepID=A0AAX4II39_9PEZI|nr:hypothetical protein CDEST_08060 [Colletotrichum destructivum]